MKIRRKHALGPERTAAACRSSAAGDAARVSWPGLHHRHGSAGRGFGLQPVRRSAQGLRDPGARHRPAQIAGVSGRPVRHHAGRRHDPLHLLRPGRRRQHRRFQRAGRPAGRSARFPDDRRLQQARAARQHDAEFIDRRRQLHRSSAGPGLPQRQRLPTRHPRAHRGHHTRQRQRHRHSGAEPERHRQQSAQSDVRHLFGRREGRSADADRHRHLRLRRQFHGPVLHDGPHRTADQGEPGLGRDRPGQHRQAGGAAVAGRCHAGARIDGAHQQDEARQDVGAERRHRRRGGQGSGAVWLREGGRPGRPLRQFPTGARSGHRPVDRRADRHILASRIRRRTTTFA